MTTLSARMAKMFLEIIDEFPEVRRGIVKHIATKYPDDLRRALYESSQRRPAEG